VELAWDLPYRSQRQPALGEDVLATSQPLAVQAGMIAFEAGGNAVDAVLAAAIALTVVEPTGNGVGGDALAIVAETDGTIHALNATGRSPARLDAAALREQGGPPFLGWETVTVPGVVSAWAALNERHGRLALADLVRPAVRYARHGFPVPPLTASAWELFAAAVASRQDFATTFLPDGRPPRAGERFAAPEQARTLELIGRTDGESFYRGELAERIVAYAASSGGTLTAEDLAGHQPEWVTPLTVPYAGVTVHEMPPSTQGVAAAVALGVLERTGHGDHDPDGAESAHLEVEAMKLGFADAHRHVGDPETPEAGDVVALLDPARLDDLAGRTDPGRAADPGHGRPWPGGTTYIAAADRDGRLVSYIQSNYFGFGSGLVVPGTGIALHNRGACFVAEAGHPNVVAPGKRPYQTIIPALLSTDDGPFCALGVMGGPMQPQGHLQVLARMLVGGRSPQAAIDAPRWQVDTGRAVHLEEGTPSAVREGLRTRGHEVHDAPRWGVQFGGAQLALRLPSGAGHLAASDPRKDGHAAAR
jgi:gamma-glutamyltranspeptidase / glutathione hydrolase